MTRVKCPGHITGFFEICRGAQARYTGSRGAGVCISKGVLTEVAISESDSPEVYVKMDGRPMVAPVTKSVANKFLNFSHKTFSLTINHKIEVPISAGFGASGAGALSTAIALNEELNLKLTQNTAATIAHIAEVENSTGLGDVIAQNNGGFEIRVEPGAPGIGKIDQIILDPSLQVICMNLGKLETKSILRDPAYRDRINKAGNKLVKELVENACIVDFLRLSREFMYDSGLLSENLRDLLNYVDDFSSLPVSMVMLGESLFTFVKKEESPELRDKIQEYSPKLDVFISDIDFQGPRIIEA